MTAKTNKLGNNSYKPKLEAMEAYATMQYVAFLHKKTVAEMAAFLGHSSGYEWMKSILRSE